MIVAIVAATACLPWSGCASGSALPRTEALSMKAPAPIIVPPDSVLAAAEEAARQHPGCFAVGGQGSSMEPLYVDGTALVVRAGGFDRLEAGTAVVYKNARGVAVAHMLVEHKGTGWTAWGMNNERTDGDLVTTDNLVGIITQAFAAETGSPSRMMATRIAHRRDAVRQGTARLDL